MLIKNCNIIYKDKIEKGSIVVKSGKIAEINPVRSEESDVIDGQGLYLSPGFIDIHIHGAGGYDTMDGSREAINNISRSIIKHGTTSFLPTTMTCDLEDIKKAIDAAVEAKTKGTDGAEVLGLHLEGPFVSPAMLGAQNPNFVQMPSKEKFNYIVGDNLEHIVSVTIAPEIEGALELIKYLKSNGITASMGHSKASYHEAVEGIKNGISHSTHLFNAMTGLHHREPGVVGAIFDTDITTETICDGIHIAYPALRTAFKIKTLDRIMLITDAMMACCMEEGLYSLGGQAVYVKSGAARLENGALAGSILTLDRAIRNVHENTDYPLHEIVRMVSYNPAVYCKVQDRKGQIKEGYDADLVMFDENIDIKMVMTKGKIYRE